MKKDKLKIIIIINIILIIAIIIFLTLRFYNNFKLNNNDSNTTNDTTNTEIIDNDNVEIVDDNIEIKKILYKERTYSFPNTFFCKNEKNSKSEDTLVINGPDDDWFSYTIRYDNFETNIYNNYNKLQNDLVNEGYDVKNPRLDEVKGNNFVVMDYYHNNYNSFVIYVSFKENEVYKIMFFNKDNSNNLNYDYLIELFEILNS